MTTSAERLHLARVAALGCIVCGSDAEIHHMKHDPATGQHLGMGQRASHFNTIPLCPRCHRTGGVGIAYHASPRTWEGIHGTEIELWRATRERLGCPVSCETGLGGIDTQETKTEGLNAETDSQKVEEA